MKQYKLRKLQAQRHFTHGRYLVGIDPAKDRHMRASFSSVNRALIILAIVYDGHSGNSSLNVSSAV